MAVKTERDMTSLACRKPKLRVQFLYLSPCM